MREKSIFLLFLITVINNEECTATRHGKNAVPHFLFWKHKYPTANILPINLNVPTFPISETYQNNYPYLMVPHNLLPYPFSVFNQQQQEEEEHGPPHQSQSIPIDNQDILVESINNALVKLNQLLPGQSPEGSENGNEEVAEHLVVPPPTVTPELLADSLNKAIDTLTHILTNNNQKLVENSDKFVIITENPQEVISGSVNEAIKKLDQLFIGLPDELKNENLNNQQHFQSFYAPEFAVYPNPLINHVPESEKTDNQKIQTTTTTTTELVETTTENFVQKITTTENVDLETTTVIPNETTTEDLFTSFINNYTAALTEPTTTTENTETTTEILIDKRFGQNRGGDDDLIVFPDQFDEIAVPDRLAPSNIHDNNLANRFGNNNNSNATPVSLQEIPLQNPMLVVLNQNNNNNNNQGATSSTVGSQIYLTYKPTRPWHAPHPIIYPQPIYTTTVRPTDVVNRFQETTVKPASVQTDLNFNANRPPVAPDPWIYPSPRPSVTSSENIVQTSTVIPPTFSRPVDRFKETTTTQNVPNSNVPIDLGFKPSRPPFQPDPWIYPSPRPVSENGNNLNDRFKETTPQTTILSTYSTTTNSPPKTKPPQNFNQNTPIVLGYKPSRPPYYPDPWIYPSPRPQTTNSNFL